MITHLRILLSLLLCYPLNVTTQSSSTPTVIETEAIEETHLKAGSKPNLDTDHKTDPTIDHKTDHATSNPNSRSETTATSASSQSSTTPVPIITEVPWDDIKGN